MGDGLITCNLAPNPWWANLQKGEKETSSDFLCHSSMRLGLGLAHSHEGQSFVLWAVHYTWWAVRSGRERKQNKNVFCGPHHKTHFFSLSLWAVHQLWWTTHSSKEHHGPSREGANLNQWDWPITLCWYIFLLYMLEPTQWALYVSKSYLYSFITVLDLYPSALFGWWLSQLIGEIWIDFFCEHWRSTYKHQSFIGK